MNTPPPDPRAASVRQRLLNRARTEGMDFQQVLTRFALERLLYRLGRSAHRERFVLKGALLFALWSDAPPRATRDRDLLGYGEPSVERLVETFRALCTMPLEREEEDGLVFLPESVAGAVIREDNVYGGIRLKATALLGSARLPVQVDVGFGDIVTPPPQEVIFPVLLELPAPRLRTYRRETVVAEKRQAMVALGQDNSRMKVFFDLWRLSQAFSFEGSPLCEAVQATFDRRRTPVPRERPVALTPAFGEDARKPAQWQGFLRRIGSKEEALSLEVVLRALETILMPVLASAARDAPLDRHWPPGGPWVSPRGSE